MLVQSVKKLEHGENCSKTRFSMSKDLLLTLINYINSKLNPGDTILLEMQEMLLIHHPIQDQSFHILRDPSQALECMWLMRSMTLLEYPFSLSYQETSLTKVPDN